MPGNEHTERVATEISLISYNVEFGGKDIKTGMNAG